MGIYTWMAGKSDSHLKWMWPAHIHDHTACLVRSYTLYEMELQLLIVKMMCSFETAGLTV